MTTPTQVQIEAAAKIIHNTHCFDDVGASPCACCKEIAKVALTAAAQVGNKLSEKDERPDIEAILKARGNIKAAIIERCAQVAEMQARSSNWQVADAVEAIAAAIRKMKDEP